MVGVIWAYFFLSKIYFVDDSHASELLSFVVEDDRPFSKGKESDPNFHVQYLLFKASGTVTRERQLPHAASFNVLTSIVLVEVGGEATCVGVVLVTAKSRGTYLERGRKKKTASERERPAPRAPSQLVALKILCDSIGCLRCHNQRLQRTGPRH